MIHNLDHSTRILQDPSTFANRFEVPREAVKTFESILRRLYRIFSHTYHHHKSVYDQFEQRTWLCTRFTRFVLHYKLMADGLIILPEEALMDHVPAAADDKSAETS